MLKELTERIRREGFGHNNEHAERDFDQALLACLESLCLETLTGGNGLIWAIAQWSEHGSAPNGQLVTQKLKLPRKIEEWNDRTSFVLESKYNGICPWSDWWLLPVESDVVELSTDNDETGLLRLTVTLNQTKAQELVAYCGEKAYLRLCLDLNLARQNDTDMENAQKAFQNLIAAPWKTINDQPIEAVVGLPADPVWPASFASLMEATFPYKERFVSVPLMPLLVDVNATSLKLSITLGDHNRATEVKNHLCKHLKLNVSPVINAVWSLKDSNHKPGTALVEGDRNLIVLEVLRQSPANREWGAKLYERRWYPDEDPSRQFDVVKLADGASAIQQLADDRPSATFRVTYLKTQSWSQVKAGAIGEESADTGSLTLTLLEKPIPARLRLAERLAWWTIRYPFPGIFSTEDLQRALKEHIPPFLRQATEGREPIICTVFGTGPQNNGRAVPITVVTLLVENPNDDLLKHQAGWLKGKLERIGLPLGTILDVRLKKTD